MKRILSLKKNKILFLLIVAFLVVENLISSQVYEGYGEGENSLFPNYVSQLSLSSCSFAWIDNTLYSLRGIWDEDQMTFSPQRYELKKTNLLTGENEIICDYIEGEYVYLVANETDVYIVVTGAEYKKNLYDKEQTDFCYMDLFTLKGIKENKSMWRIKTNTDSWIWGLYLENYILYASTSQEIISIDIKSGVQSVIYVSSEELQNWIQKDRLILEDRRLYFLEGNTVSYIDIETKTVQKLTKISSVLNQTGSTAVQNYWVHRGHLYFWDENIKATVEMDVDTSECKIVSDSRFYFGQANEYGIVLCEIPPEQIDSYSVQYRDKMIYEATVSKDWFYEYTPSGEIDFSTSYRYLIDADSAVLVDDRYFSYVNFHVQDGVLDVSEFKKLPITKNH